MPLEQRALLRVPGVLKIFLPKISYNYDPLLKLAVVFFLDLIA